MRFASVLVAPAPIILCVMSKEANASIFNMDFGHDTWLIIVVIDHEESLNKAILNGTHAPLSSSVPRLLHLLCCPATQLVCLRSLSAPTLLSVPKPLRLSYRSPDLSQSRSA